MKDPSQAIVPPPARVEDVPWRHPQGQPARVHDLESIGMEVEEDVAALRVRAVDERVHEQLANDYLLERRDGRAQHAVGELVALAEVGDLLPDRVDQPDRRERVVIPDQLADLGAALVVLDGLDDRRRPEHEHAVRLKLNTVVTALNQHEDLSPLVRAIRPERWKVFQVLPVAGQNDGKVEPLLIDGDQFQAYVDRHAHLAAEGLGPIAEDNDDMTGSYVMIDPMGRFFDNVDGRLVYSPAILDVGVEEAFASVRWERARLVARGGLYAWRRPRGQSPGSESSGAA